MTEGTEAETALLLPTTCDRCGEELPRVYARVEVGWSIATYGKTVFGGPLSPGRAKRVLCPKCFKEAMEVVGARIGVDA